MKNPFLKLFIFIPVLNILADLTLYFNRGGIHFGEIRALFELVFIIFVLARTNVFNYTSTKIILLFSFYTLIKLGVSSDFLYGFSQSYLKVTIAHFLFPLAIYFIRDLKSYKQFLISSLIAGIIISINYIISQFFSIGQSVYIADSFYLGALGAGTVSMLALPILANIQLKKMLHNRQSKIIVNLIIVIMILFVFLVMKRIAIIVLLLGLFTQFVVLQNRNNNIRNILFLVLSLGLLYGVFGSFFIERFEARTQEKNEIQNESRYYETVIVFEELKTGTFSHIVFGSEMYNSVKYFKKYFGKERQLHIDYNIILHGSGLLGLAIYLVFLYLIYIAFKTMTKKVKRFENIDDNYYNLVAIFYSMYVANIFLSFSGGIAYLSLKSFFMMHLGAVYGLVYWRYYKPLSYPKSYNNFNLL